jgi:hypothetical protein
VFVKPRKFVAGALVTFMNIVIMDSVVTLITVVLVALATHKFVCLPRYY